MNFESDFKNHSRSWVHY